MQPSSHVAMARMVLEAEAEAIRQAGELLDAAFDRAVEVLQQCRGHVVLSGMGKSGLIARKISATLSSLGTASHFLHPAEAVHGDMGRIRSEDVLLAISHSGTTEEILTLAALVRQDGVKVVSISSGRGTHLAGISDVALAVGEVREACPNNLAPTASTTATLALGDALALAVSSARGFTAEDFRKRHPGGALGRQMLPLEEVLRFRVGVNLPVLAETLGVGEALALTAQMPRRAGAVLLVGEDGRLTGIFTDGDLRRLVTRSGPEALARRMLDVMTRAPTTLGPGSLVRDAVQLIRERRVDEVPVVDGSGRPVGLLDVQDLIGLRVIEP